MVVKHKPMRLVCLYRLECVSKSNDVMVRCLKLLHHDLYVPNSPIGVKLCWTRIFHMKVEDFVKLLNEKKKFGHVTRASNTKNGTALIKFVVQLANINCY